MIIVREGTIIYKLLTVIAYAGEFPFSAKSMLGEYTRSVKRCREYLQRQTYYNPKTGEVITCRAISVVGKHNRDKSFHITKGGQTLLEWIGMLGQYKKVITNDHIQPNERDRHHRVAEVVLMCLNVNIPIVTEGDPINKDYYPLVRLCKNEELSNCYMPSKKGTADKVMFTRVIGTYLDDNVFYYMYNTRDRAMVWMDGSESKTKSVLQNFAKTHTGVENASAAVLFGKNYKIGQKVIEESAREIKQKEEDKSKLSGIFSDIYFIPLNKFGIDLLKIIKTKDFHENIVRAFIRPKRTIGKTNISVLPSDDARRAENGDVVYIFSFLDSNLGELLQLRRGLDAHKNVSAVVVCYPEQKEFVNTLFSGTKYTTKEVTINEVKKELHIDVQSDEDKEAKEE